MKLGLLGFPEVGKKTLFELLTGKGTGLVKGIGIAYIRDERFNQLVKMYKPKKTTPATLEFLIIPDIREQNNAKIFQDLQNVDVLCHVVRAFKDDAVFHIKGSVDPARDIKMVNDELILNDLLFIEKRTDRLKKEFTKKSAQSIANEERLLLCLKQHLEAGKPLRSLSLSDEEKKFIKSYPFSTIKNIIVALNVGEDDIANDRLLETLKAQFADQNMKWTQISAKIEREISTIESEQEKQDFFKEMGIDSPALEKLTILSYKTLDLITFFTVRKNEVRAWMIPQGSRAPEAARAVHTDMEKGFIRAEVIKYDDLVELGDEKKVKESGKYMLKGKDYIVEDGDILNFLFNV
jgi:hypothetical protein